MSLSKFWYSGRFWYFEMSKWMYIHVLVPVCEQCLQFCLLACTMYTCSSKFYVSCKYKAKVRL